MSGDALYTVSSDIDGYNAVLRAEKEKRKKNDGYRFEISDENAKEEYLNKFVNKYIWRTGRSNDVDGDDGGGNDSIPPGGNDNPPGGNDNPPGGNGNPPGGLNPNGGDNGGSNGNNGGNNGAPGDPKKEGGILDDGMDDGGN